MLLQCAIVGDQKGIEELIALLKKHMPNANKKESACLCLQIEPGQKPVIYLTPAYYAKTIITEVDPKNARQKAGKRIRSALKKTVPQDYHPSVEKDQGGD